MNLGRQHASVTTGYARIAIASAALDAYLVRPLARAYFGASASRCIL